MTSPPTPKIPTLRPRREPFEHGLLPVTKLTFTDGIQTLAGIRLKLTERSGSTGGLVSADIVADVLQISPELAALVLETLVAVLPGDREIGSVDVYDLLLFLYIQGFKRLVPRPSRDSAAVVDVWPSNSAFDGCLSALTPLQLARNNSRRFMPSQADEEAHQLSYLHKHMGKILGLLSDEVEGEGNESAVLTLERLEHLGFLIQFSGGIQLSQAVPFFANSDSDMPAVPVSVAQIHEWILQSIAATLEANAERSFTKESSSQQNSDADVTMVESRVNNTRLQNSSSFNRVQSNPTYAHSPNFVEGISKTSVVKQPGDFKGQSVKVLNCHDSVIYILAPLKYATVYGCSDATVILGAIGKAVRVEHCERVQIIAAAKRICIANCRECVFFLGVNQQPLIIGDNYKLQVAPFNTYYSQLEEHIAQVGVDPSINKWDQPQYLGMVDPHDSLSHPAGVSDVQAESATCLDPEQFTNFVIPNWFGPQPPELTKCNPFTLPEAYRASQAKKHSHLGDAQQSIRDLQLDESRKRELASALHIHFKDWLYASGNIRQLYCLQNDLTSNAN